MESAAFIESDIMTSYFTKRSFSSTKTSISVGIFSMLLSNTLNNDLSLLVAKTSTFSGLTLMMCNSSQGLHYIPVRVCWL